MCHTKNKITATTNWTRINRREKLKSSARNFMCCTRTPLSCRFLYRFCQCESTHFSLLLLLFSTCFILPSFVPTFWTLKFAIYLCCSYICETMTICAIWKKKECFFLFELVCAPLFTGLWRCFGVYASFLSTNDQKRNKNCELLAWTGFSSGRKAKAVYKQQQHSSSLENSSFCAQTPVHFNKFSIGFCRFCSSMMLYSHRILLSRVLVVSAFYVLHSRSRSWTQCTFLWVYRF